MAETRSELMVISGMGTVKNRGNRETKKSVRFTSHPPPLPPPYTHILIQTRLPTHTQTHTYTRVGRHTHTRAHIQNTRETKSKSKNDIRIEKGRETGGGEKQNIFTQTAGVIITYVFNKCLS